MNNILVIGDSWASAIESDSGQDRKGWPEILGIPQEMRQAVAGTTAYDWATDHNGMLSKARNTPADAIVISLMGNDALLAIADGNVDVSEIGRAATSMEDVLTFLRRPTTVVILYADPFLGSRQDATLGVQIINVSIRVSVKYSLRSIPVLFLDASQILTDPSHFNGTEIHPTRLGHQAIAQELTRMLQQQETKL